MWNGKHVTLLVLGNWLTGCSKVHVRLILKGASRTPEIEKSVWERNYWKSNHVRQFRNLNSSTLRTQVDQLRRQLDVRFFFTWYYTQPEVDILTRRNRLAVNWYIFIDHEYNFFNAIVSRLIALKILKSQNYLNLLTPEGAAKTIALQSLFSIIKPNLLPKNGHKLKCLDKSLMTQQNFSMKKLGCLTGNPQAFC